MSTGRRARPNGRHANPRAVAGAILTTVALLAVASRPAVAAGAMIRLSPAVGPPTTRITVMGRGFGPTEVVDLSFDAQPSRRATTDPSGAFSTPIRVPASAMLGDHTVDATGETSGLSASAPFTVRTDWPMFKFGPDHVGLNPYENVLSPSTVGGLQAGWTFGAPEFFDDDPAVSGGRVFAGAGDTIYAIDAATGALLWSRTHYLSPIASPAVWRGVAYYATATGTVHAARAATGEDLWTYSVPTSVSDLTLANGILYFGGGGNGIVYALDASTGTELWDTYIETGAYASPAEAGGVVYAVSVNGNSGLNALDAFTGAILWTGPTGGFGNYSSPAVAGGLVYMGSNAGNLFAFPAAGCGQAVCPPVWTATTGGGIQSSPSVAYGMVFVGSYDHNVYAFDAASGALVWTVITGDQITIAAPAVANGVVYIGSNDHVLRAIDALTGQVLWTYTTGNLVGGGAAVVNGWVYVGSLDKSLYAFHLPGW